MAHRITDYQKASSALKKIARDLKRPLRDREEARRHLHNLQLLQQRKKQTKATGRGFARDP